MALRYGVDTSILVRLVAKEPQRDFERCVSQLVAMVEERGCELFASNQAIGEAYAALIHHYSISSIETRARLGRRAGERPRRPSERVRCARRPRGEE